MGDGRSGGGVQVATSGGARDVILRRDGGDEGNGALLREEPQGARGQENGGLGDNEGAAGEPWDQLVDPEEAEALGRQLTTLENPPLSVPLITDGSYVHELGKDVLVERAFDAYVRPRWRGRTVLHEPRLVPVRLAEAIDGDGPPREEVVAWDVFTDPSRVPEIAREIVRRNGDAEKLSGTVAEKLQRTLEDQELLPASKRAAPPAGPSADGPAGEDRRKLQLRMELVDESGKVRVLMEELEWDLAADQEVNSPEWCALYLCRDLRLGEHNVPAVAEHLRVQIRAAERSERLEPLEEAKREYDGTARERDDARALAFEVVHGVMDRAVAEIDRLVREWVPEQKPHPRASANRGTPRVVDPEHGGPRLWSAPSSALYGLTVDNRRRKGTNPAGTDSRSAELDITAAEVLPIACAFPGCGRRFKQASKAQRHECLHYDGPDHVVLGRLSALDEVDDDEEDRTMRQGSRFVLDNGLPYRCPYEGCIKGFYFRSQLQRHKIYHEKEGHALRPDADGIDDWQAQQASFPGRTSMFTRRTNPMPLAGGGNDRSSLGLRSSPKGKFVQRRDRKDPALRTVKPTRPPPPMVNAIVEGIDLRMFRLHAYKTEELQSFRDGKTKPRHNHAKGGGCIPCKIKTLGVDINKMRQAVRVWLREMRKMRGLPPEVEPEPEEADAKKEEADAKKPEADAKQPETAATGEAAAAGPGAAGAANGQNGAAPGEAADGVAEPKPPGEGNSAEPPQPTQGPDKEQAAKPEQSEPTGDPAEPGALAEATGEQHPPDLGPAAGEKRKLAELDHPDQVEPAGNADQANGGVAEAADVAAAQELKGTEVPT